MKLKRLEINCFRGINNLTIDFVTTEPTVFIGVNGVGKSSILDCIAILFSWLLALIEFDPAVKYISRDYDYLSTYNKHPANEYCNYLLRSDIAAARLCQRSSNIL